MKVTARIASLRTAMKAAGVNAYIVPGTDPHASEYMAAHWMEMQWISGFTGESGTAVITENEALLWTDSRYYLQADIELKDTGIKLMRESDIDCPSITDWLSCHCQGTIGVNAEMYSVNSYSNLQKVLGENQMAVKSIDLIRSIWTVDRPEIPMHPILPYSEKYAGESVPSKLARVRKAIQEQNAEAIVVAELDEIGWLLNIRGRDVDYTPCVIAYCIVEQTSCTIFVDDRKLTDDAKKHLKQNGITTRKYEDVFTYLKTIDARGVMLDGNRVNEALYEAINPAVERKIVISPSPVQIMMSIKNDVEIAGEREAMIQDGVALTRFFMWLDNEARNMPQTEITIAEKLGQFRASSPTYTDDSFCTIPGWNGNGAIVHYHATPENCAKIEGDGVLLLDSGGQYMEGTTDITRTLWIGNEQAIPTELKQDFTLVLKGHIALAKARFPKGTRGNQLDILARQFMWQKGIHYGHGTGHGVGHYMGCHEGPANIRTDNNTNPIRLGNIFSNEPGIYREGRWGIRTENLILTKEVPSQERSTGETYYEFETLTLCFYDRKLMDMQMLSQEEIQWINAYHQKVYNTLKERLNSDEQTYLAEKCKAL